jgi:hypothetical protein
MLKANNVASPSAVLGPINIKLAKEKSKVKKENKPKKSDHKEDDKKTKRKERKKPQGELNITIVVKDSMDGTSYRKEAIALERTKARTSEKYFRNSSRLEQTKKSTGGEWLSGFLEENSVVESYKPSKRPLPRKKDRKTLPNEEFLFIGDEFYFVNNFCPTKRILNTFRDVCSSADSKIKFVTQDKTDRLLSLNLKKKNIFSEARREI